MNRTLQPPEWMSRLLRCFHPVANVEEVEGDLAELYVYWGSASL